jgi:hypothetical protein
VRQQVLELGVLGEDGAERAQDHSVFPHEHNTLAAEDDTWCIWLEPTLSTLTKKMLEGISRFISRLEYTAETHNICRVP